MKNKRICDVCAFVTGGKFSSCPSCGTDLTVDQKELDDLKNKINDTIRRLEKADMESFS